MVYPKLLVPTGVAVFALFNHDTVMRPSCIMGGNLLENIEHISIKSKGGLDTLVGEPGPIESVRYTTVCLRGRLTDVGRVPGRRPIHELEP